MTVRERIEAFDRRPDAQRQGALSLHAVPAGALEPILTNGSFLLHALRIKGWAGLVSDLGPHEDEHRLAGAIAAALRLDGYRLDVATSDEAERVRTIVALFRDAGLLAPADALAALLQDEAVDLHPIAQIALADRRRPIARIPITDHVSAVCAIDDTGRFAVGTTSGALYLGSPLGRLRRRQLGSIPIFGIDRAPEGDAIIVLTPKSRALYALEPFSRIGSRDPRYRRRVRGFATKRVDEPRYRSSQAGGVHLADLSPDGSLLVVQVDQPIYPGYLADPNAGPRVLQESGAAQRSFIEIHRMNTALPLGAPPKEPDSTPVIASDGEVFIHDRATGLLALEVHGDELRTTQLFTASNAREECIMARAATVEEQLVLFRGRDWFAVHDRRTGDRVAFVRLGSTIQDARLIAPDRLLACTGGRVDGLFEFEFRAHDDVTCVWGDESYVAEAAGLGTPICAEISVRSDLIIVGTDRGLVRASRPSSRETCWLARSRSLVRTVCITADRVYLGDNSGAVLCVDAATGIEEWSRSIHPGGVSGIAPNPRTGWLATTSSAGTLRILDDAGEPRCGVVLPALAASPVWLDAQRLLVSTVEGVHLMQLSVR